MKKVSTAKLDYEPIIKMYQGPLGSSWDLWDMIDKYLYTETNRIDTAMITLNSSQQLEFNIQMKRFPTISFRASRITLPSISLNAVDRPTPFKKLVETADTLTYGDFSITFTLDENLATFLEIFEWMKGIAFPASFSQYRELRDSRLGLKSDISVSIMSSKKNVSFVAVLEDAFPTNIDGIQLDSTQQTVVGQEMTVNFAFNSFRIDKAE